MDSAAAGPAMGDKSIRALVAMNNAAACYVDVHAAMAAYRDRGTTLPEDILETKSIDWKTFGENCGMSAEQLDSVTEVTLEYNQPGEFMLDLVLKSPDFIYRLYMSALSPLDKHNTTSPYACSLAAARAITGIRRRAQASTAPSPRYHGRVHNDPLVAGHRGLHREKPRGARGACSPGRAFTHACAALLRPHQDVACLLHVAFIVITRPLIRPPVLVHSRGPPGAVAHSHGPGIAMSVHYYELTVMTYNIGLTHTAITPQLAAKSPKEREELLHALTAMISLLTTRRPDVMVVQAFGDQEEGVETEESLEAIMRDILPNNDDAMRNVFDNYVLHASHSYLAWLSKERVQVIGTSRLQLAPDFTGQAWRVAQVIDLSVWESSPGMVPTRPPQGMPHAHARIINTHLKSSQDDTLDYKLHVACLERATTAAVAHTNGRTPRISIVAGDLGINSDEILYEEYGHALHKEHAWCIGAPGSHKDFILSTGQSGFDTIIHRTSWRAADQQSVSPGTAHWPIAVRVDWDSGILPPLPSLTGPSMPLVRRVEQMVCYAEKAWEYVLHACAQACAHAHAHRHMHARTRMHMCTCMHACMQCAGIYACLHACRGVCVCVYARMRACRHACVHACMHARAHMCAGMHTSLHYMHRHRHAFTHAQKHLCRCTRVRPHTHNAYACICFCKLAKFFREALVKAKSEEESDDSEGSVGADSPRTRTTRGVKEMVKQEEEMVKQEEAKHGNTRGIKVGDGRNGVGVDGTTKKGGNIKGSKDGDSKGGKGGHGKGSNMGKHCKGGRDIKGGNGNIKSGKGGYTNKGTAGYSEHSGANSPIGRPSGSSGSTVKSSKGNSKGESDTICEGEGDGKNTQQLRPRAVRSMQKHAWRLHHVSRLGDISG